MSAHGIEFMEPKVLGRILELLIDRSSNNKLTPGELLKEYNDILKDAVNAESISRIVEREAKGKDRKLPHGFPVRLAKLTPNSINLFLKKFGEQHNISFKDGCWIHQASQ